MQLSAALAINQCFLEQIDEHRFWTPKRTLSKGTVHAPLSTTYPSSLLQQNTQQHEIAMNLKLYLSVSIAFTFSLLSLSAQASSPTAGEDNLLAVIEETIETNPELQARWNAFRAARQDEREAFGGYLPSIDLNGAVGRAEREFDGRGHYARHYGEISLTQMLFDGFRVKNQLSQTEHSRKARYYELLDEAEGKALEAAQAYLDVQRYRDTVVLARENYRQHQQVHQHIEERARRGVGNRADLRQISGRLALAQANLETEIANLHDVTARFMRIVGRLPSDRMAPVNPLDGRIPAGIEAVLAEVYANNPALYAAYENIQAHEAAHKARKANRYPHLELGLRHGLYKNNNGFDSRTDPDSYGNETIVELRLRYNLYRGGSDMAAERAALRRIDQAENLLDKTCIDLRQTTSIAHHDILNLSRKIESLKTHRDGARDVVIAYREQFDIGRRSLLDVLDSENEAFQAERAYTHGRYDLLSARYRTLNGMGRLMQALSLQPEQFKTLQDPDDDYGTGSAGRYCRAYHASEWDASRLLSFETQQAPSPRGGELVQLESDALFDVGSARLKQTADMPLMNLAMQLLELDDIEKITIVGHTDSTGSDAINRQLSLQRAIAARDYLVAAGVDGAIISISGVAADHPVASNATAAGRAANRRVEIRVIRSR